MKMKMKKIDKNLNFQSINFLCNKVCFNKGRTGF